MQRNSTIWSEPPAPAALVLAALGCALVVAATGCGQSSTYTLMQMNLCLSGIAGCSARTAYPAIPEKAEARIREVHPDAVTVNEACRNDVAQIAGRTGYHLRFSRVIYLGRPLRCVLPGGRGLFGDAVLTKAAIASTDSRAFKAQAGVERRRWLCVSTRVRVDVCTAHLNERIRVEVAGNDAQCAELGTLLSRRAAGRTVIFGGDVNRHPSCAPSGFWTRTDSSAHQAAGLQQVYGTGALRSPTAEVLMAPHTDHDVLVVRAHLPARRREPESSGPSVVGETGFEPATARPPARGFQWR